MDTHTRKLLRIGVVANIFEWYEFTIFGFLAPLLGELFFKSTRPIISLIQSFSVFSLSYVARPLGSLFFGLMGDRIGRVASVRLSLILMSVPTFLIGLVPTYDQVGILAITSLVILRLIQGFAAGGELPGIALCFFSNVFNSS